VSEGAAPAAAVGTAGLVSDRLRTASEIFAAAAGSGLPALAAQAAERITAALRAGGKVLFFGNGGSAADAAHLATELVGRFYLDRAPLAALSLADPTTSLTALGNDYGFADVFARQVAALGRPGDVAVGLSTSGSSANVVAALRTARERRLGTVALTGAAGGAVAEHADICLAVPTTDTPRVQELCMHLGHTICELVERAMTGGP
jgi:D-sedoheptulose 7-phosphate isomerase